MGLTEKQDIFPSNDPKDKLIEELRTEMFRLLEENKKLKRIIKGSST